MVLSQLIIVCNKILDVKKNKFIVSLGFIAVLMLSGCSVNIMKYSILSNYDLNIPKDNGVKVTGYSDAWFKSQSKAVKEATENALKQAGPEYDLLLNGNIESEYKFLFLRYRVSGTAYKSVDLINKNAEIGFEN